eukprot:197245-Hanusia_phi.AAC.1
MSSPRRPSRCDLGQASMHVGQGKPASCAYKREGNQSASSGVISQEPASCLSRRSTCLGGMKASEPNSML